jgi:thiamine biosynthesis protein ThiI
LKPGELYLKGGNQREFVRALKRNLEAMLTGTGAKLTVRPGRFFVDCPAEADAVAEDAFSRLYGITGWAKARKIAKTPEAVVTTCVTLAGEAQAAGARSFRIEARRSDKSFPLSSQQICVTAGAAVCAALPGLKAQMTGADAVISVEVRDSAYVYGASRRGLRGLPVGTAGRGMLLLSGGIDSPVAGYLMAGRGLGLEAVYFHAPPYTGDDALHKVERLSSIVGRYAMGVRLHALVFTEVEQRIKDRAPEAWRTLLLRMAMMESAEKLARERGCKCLVTGESLSQVASQTVENIACAESVVTMPVMRPLIGMDKEAIIALSKQIGAYETSILPYEDCCVLFSPEHPVLHAKMDEAMSLYKKLELNSIIECATSLRHE